MANHRIFKAAILFAVAIGTFCKQSARVTYTCLEQNGPQLINASETIRLHLKHPIYTYLHPNQKCELRIRYKTGSGSSSRPHRWLVSVVNASIKAYSASAKFFNSLDSSLAASMGPALTSETPLLDGYQFITAGDNFSVLFSTKKLPEAHSTGLVLLAEPFDRCPSGWFDTGISCYGSPNIPSTALASQADGKTACSRLGDGRLSQGVYIGDHIGESIKNLLAVNASDGSQSLQNYTYWVGIVRAAEGLGGVEGAHEFAYSNGYKIPHTVEPCEQQANGSSSTACNCVIYHSGRFIAAHCNDAHRYICAMPLPSSVCSISSCRHAGADSVGGIGCDSNQLAMASSTWRYIVITPIILIVLALLIVLCLPPVRQLVKNSAPV